MQGPRVDLQALRRTTSRLAAASQPPWLHEEAARRLAGKLPMVRLQPAAVLDWSGPLGASVPHLRDAYPKARLQQVAPGGLGPAGDPRAAGSRWWPWRRRAPETIPAVAPDAVPEAGAELLWSNMMLHGAADPRGVIGQWHRALAVGGFLMFSTLGAGSLAELRGVYRRQGWGEPMAPLMDMHDIGDLLVQAGFGDPVMDQETLTLSWSGPDALLAELRSWGGNVSPERFQGCRTPRWRQRLLDALAAEAEGARPRLSVELVYGHAFRTPAPARVAPTTSVALEDMRRMVRGARRAGG